MPTPRHGSDRDRRTPGPPARPATNRAPVVVVAALTAPVVVYAFLPTGPVRDVVNPLIGLLCLSTAFWGLLRAGRPRPGGWGLVLAGFLGWVLGDLQFMVEHTLIDVSAYPAPSDAVYVGSYGLLAAGLVVIVRRRGSGSDLPALLDAAILATGTAVIAGVFVIAPIAGDSSLSLLGKLTSAAYPVADVLLLGIVARLWTTPGARTAAFKLLSAALAMTLIADAWYNVTALQTGSVISYPVNDLFWLGSYVLIAGAAWSPSLRTLAEPPPGREDLADPTKRMVVLTLGLLLPGVTLLVDDLAGGVSGVLIALGSILLSVLVLARMAGLLSVVRGQAVQLAALARSDALTGVPNRRTLDFELSRACHTAREERTPLTLALLDLDRFKSYNDTHGHLAGDLLLREAAAAWTAVLSDGELLARYGGEEFVVLFPGQTAAQAEERVLALLRVTPNGQTFSAGVAAWDRDTEPAALLAAADVAMYTAKSTGRNRVCLALDRKAPDHLVPDIVLQPIVDLESGEPIAVEALSRFRHGDPATVFAAARVDGSWPLLEAAAITAALAVRPADLLITLNVSLDGIETEPVRKALDRDLTGVVLEFTELSDSEPSGGLHEEVERLRERGALVAVDDWGSGFSNLDRVLLLRPDLVKIDMSLVHHLELDYHRAAIQSLCGWGDAVGARICAEGVETEEQARRLGELGVHLGQGWFFGVPSATGRDPGLSRPVGAGALVVARTTGVPALGPGLGAHAGTAGRQRPRDGAA